MPKGPGTETLRVGLAAIKPGDGAVVAMYGGADFQKNQFNTATQAQMQAGSTYKAFSLIAALQQGISTKTRFNGATPQYFPQYQDSKAATSFLRAGGVANFNDEQFGNIDLRTATGHSVNTVFAQLNIKVGPDKTKAAAVAAGLPEKAQNSTYSNVFGTSHEHVMDMANAYATIAAQGLRTTPYLIKSVNGGPGGLSYTAKPAPKPVFDKKVMADDDRRAPAARQDRHGDLRPGPRPAGRGQDRHDHGQQVGLVRRLHPSAHGRGRHVQHGQERRRAVDEQRAWRGSGHRWHGAGPRSGPTSCRRPCRGNRS